jgi:hypothetical protein
MPFIISLIQSLTFILKLHKLEANWFLEKQNIVIKFVLLFRVKRLNDGVAPGAGVKWTAAREMN